MLTGPPRSSSHRLLRNHLANNTRAEKSVLFTPWSVHCGIFYNHNKNGGYGSHEQVGARILRRESCPGSCHTKGSRLFNKIMFP